MNFARKSLLVLITPLLPVLLFATAFDIGVLNVVGNSGSVKHILSDSGIYNSVISNALDQAKKSTEGGSEVSLTDPAIKKAAESTFTPAYVQQSTEKVIDGIYDWLNGKTPQPNFNVDLSQLKGTFADKVGEAAQARAATLPVCVGGAVPNSTDPFSSTCLPRGLTPKQVGSQARLDVLNGQGFLENAAVTPNSIKGSGSNQSVFNDQLKSAPVQYQRIKSTPMILAVLSLLTTAGIILLSPSRRKGLRHVGTTLVLVGVFMMIFAWGLSRVVSHNVVPKINLDNKVLQSKVRTLASSLSHNVDKNYWLFGGAYTVLGALAIGTVIYAGRGGKKPPAGAGQKTVASPTSSSPPAYKVPAKAVRPPKKIRLIQ